jgi:hypothetical protein
VAAARVRYHCACAGAMRSMERRGSEDPPVGAVRSVVRVGGATYGCAWVNDVRRRPPGDGLWRDH